MRRRSCAAGVMRSACVLAAVAAWACAGTARAAVIVEPAVNPGFEDLTGSDPSHFDSGKLKDGHFSTKDASAYGANAYQTSDPIPGWFISPGASGEAGTYNPTLVDYPGGIPGEQNVAWSSGPLILQTLDAVVTADTQYTFSVWVGNRATTNYQGYSVHVRVNGLDGLLYDIAPAVHPANPTPGTFDQLILSGFVGNDPNLVGRPIQIWMGPQGGLTDFDNPELLAGPGIPEPGTASLLGGVGVLVLARRRRTH